MEIYTTVQSPVGELTLAGRRDGTLGRLAFGRTAIAGAERDDDGFADVRDQLAEYFAGRRQAFSIPLEPAGTEWERSVWDVLATIPYGQTWSYGQVAAVACPRTGARAARAVGAANGRNPIAIIVPCHRVIGADGSLTGFGGGLEVKRRLLDLEAGRLALI